MVFLHLQDFLSFQWKSFTLVKGYTHKAVPSIEMKWKAFVWDTWLYTMKLLYMQMYMNYAKAKPLEKHLATN